MLFSWVYPMSKLPYCFAHELVGIHLLMFHLMLTISSIHVFFDFGFHRFALQECTPCPLGSSCENVTEAPVECSPNSYSGLGEWTCEICPAGHRCRQLSSGGDILPSVPRICPQGMEATFTPVAVYPYCNTWYW